MQSLMRYLLCLITACFVVNSAAGATYTVSDATSLVNYINSNNGISGGGTVIIVNAGTYGLSTSLHAGGDPNIAIDITQPITIQAAAGTSPVISMSNVFGVRVQASNTVIDGLTLAGAQFGIQIQNVTTGLVSNMTLRRVTVNTTGTTGQAISAGGMVDSIIEYCAVTNTYNSGITLSNYPPIANTPSLRNLVINNSITNTTAGQGIGVTLSDYNVIAGNTITDTGADGILVNGGQHNYIGQNTILRPGNGVTLTLGPSSRQSNRNYVGNNSMTLNAKPGTDTLWFNYDSDYNMGFLNEGSGAYEGGMSLFNSVGNYVRGNNWHNNPNGGIIVQRDSGSGTTVPTRNSVQQNYLHDYPANGGIVTSIETLNDFGFNYIAGTPATANQTIAGILLQGSTNSNFYSNVIRDLLQAEQVQGVTVSSTTYNSSGDVFYLNRHLNTTNDYLLSGSTAQFDSGSTTLGGNYYSNFNANGNPSTTTPNTNIINQVGTMVAQDRYPYQSESLGKNYSVGVRLPSTGSYLAVGTSKTIAWSSQGCMMVDIFLLNANGTVNATIASNAPDYGYYRWTVPAVTNQNYKVRVDCKLSSGGATGVTSVGGLFAITTPDLVLLSPQSNLVIDSGLNLQVSWKKSSAIAAVDVYIRYSDASAYTLVQAAVTADYLTIATPVTSSNRASVRIAYGGYGDSTDGWFTIRGSSAGIVTAPGSAGNLYVGTPSLIEWVAPQGTDYVNIDLIGSGTRNIVTQLADFSNYLMLVPDQQGAGSTLRLSFYTAAGTLLGTQISSPPQSVLNSTSQPYSIAVSTGSGQAASIGTTFATALQAIVTNNYGTGISGAAVTFTAPSSGASGTFSGSTTVVTNSSGIATAPAFTANSTPGAYVVTATTGGLSASFNLTNSAGTGQTNVGFYYNGYFVLDANGSGAYEGPPGDKNFLFISPMPGDIAVKGDWNHDGRTKAGIYRNGFWILDYNGNGVYDAGIDKFYAFGGTGTQYIPVVGDWNGDGRSKIGYYNNGFWVLDYNGDGVANSGDLSYAFGGNPNEVPLLGDWNHDGRTKIGIFYSGNFVVDYDGDGHATAADKFSGFILPYANGDKPLVGDWSGNGFSKIGIYRNGFWILDYNGNYTYDGVGANQDKFYGFGGNASEIPVVGDWNGSGTSKIGIYLSGFWALDYNGNGSFDGTGAGQDRFIAFGGNSGEQPLIGKW